MSIPTPEELAAEQARKIFAAGYLLGGKHGYAAAVEESYPELREGQTEVGAAIEDQLDNFFLAKNPDEDFQ